MTSQGTASGRFTRAIKRGHLLAAETAAREMGSLSLSEALSLCLLLERENDERWQRAFRRWLRRMQLERGLRREQVELLRAAAGALRSPFRDLGLAVLEGASRELRLKPPTGTPQSSDFALESKRIPEGRQ
jgi:hypothetical protein